MWRIIEKDRQKVNVTEERVPTLLTTWMKGTSTHSVTDMWHPSATTLVLQDSNTRPDTYGFMYRFVFLWCKKILGKTLMSHRHSFWDFHTIYELLAQSSHEAVENIRFAHFTNNHLITVFFNRFYAVRSFIYCIVKSNSWNLYFCLDPWRNLGFTVFFPRVLVSNALFVFMSAFLGSLLMAQSDTFSSLVDVVWTWSDI